MRYKKPYLPVADQLALLAERGMTIENRDKAAEYLARLGYYRLSAYWYPFRATHSDPAGNTIVTDSFKKGTSFDIAVKLYAFDKALRLQLLDVLERIEIGIRTQIALELGAYDPWAHREARLLGPRFTRIDPKTGRVGHTDWLAKLDDKALSSKEEFADHFRRKYTASHMPIWIAVELLDFGPLSIFLSGMKPHNIASIASHFNVPDWQLFVSWIRALSVLRNVCAHHARLWNRPLADQPKLPADGRILELDHLAASPHTNKRLYSACAIARYLLKVVNPRTQWQQRLREHLGTFPTNPHVTLKTAGFPEKWDALPLWQ